MGWDVRISLGGVIVTGTGRLGVFCFLSWELTTQMCSHTSVLAGFRPRQTRHSLRFDEKNVWALGTCSGLAAFAGTCTSHDTAPQEKMLHHLVPVGFGTRHRFRMTTEVPLYTLWKIIELYSYNPPCILQNVLLCTCMFIYQQNLQKNKELKLIHNVGIKYESYQVQSRHFSFNYLLKFTVRDLGNITATLMRGAVSSPNPYVAALNTRNGKCDLTWRWGHLYGGDQVKMRSWGWALIQYDWHY